MAVQERVLCPLAMEILKAWGINPSGVNELDISFRGLDVPRITIRRMIEDAPDRFTPVYERYEAVRRG